MSRIKHRIGIEAIVASCIALLACNPAWRNFRSDERNSGTINIRSETVGNVKWAFPAAKSPLLTTRESREVSPATVDFDNMIYVAASSLLYVIDPNGHEKCHFSPPPWGGDSNRFPAAPTLTASSIYIGSLDKNVYSINKQNCNLNWTFRTDDWIESSPIVVGNKVIVSSRDGFLYSLSADIGQLDWKFSYNLSRSSLAFSDSHSSPAYSSAAGGLIFMGSLDSYLYAVDYNTGLQKWRMETNGPIEASPAVTSFRGTNIVVVGSDNPGIPSGKLYAYVAESGQELWEFDTAPVEAISSSAALTSDGKVYFATTSGKLIALNVVDGTLLWKIDLPGANVLTSPSMAGDVLYIGGNFNFFAVDVTTRTIKWVYQTDGMFAQSPAIGGDGTVYIGADNGTFFAFN